MGKLTCPIRSSLENTKPGHRRQLQPEAKATYGIPQKSSHPVKVPVDSIETPGSPGPSPLSSAKDYLHFSRSLTCNFERSNTHSAGPISLSAPYIFDLLSSISIIR